MQCSLFFVLLLLPYCRATLFPELKALMELTLEVDFACQLTVAIVTLISDTIGKQRFLCLSIADKHDTFWYGMSNVKD